MDDAAGIVVLAIAMAVVIPWLTISSRRKKEEAGDEMARRQFAYRKALDAGDPQAVIRTGSELLEAARTWQPASIGSVADSVYRDALTFLKSHPEAKPFALSIGRTAYAWKRPDRKLTIYD